MTAALITIFVIGYILIALEHSLKINKSTYFILNELSHAVPDYGYGLNPYEDKEYEYTQTYKSMVFKNNVLYKMDGGELKKDEDSEMIKFINYGKTLL